MGREAAGARLGPLGPKPDSPAPRAPAASGSGGRSPRPQGAGAPRGLVVASHFANDDCRPEDLDRFVVDGLGHPGRWPGDLGVGLDSSREKGVACRRPRRSSA